MPALTVVKKLVFEDVHRGKLALFFIFSNSVTSYNILCEKVRTFFVQFILFFANSSSHHPGKKCTFL